MIRFIRNKYRVLAGIYWLCLPLSITLPTKAQTAQPPAIQWQRILGPAYTAYPLQITRASSDGYAISYGSVLRLSESGSTLWQTSIPPSPEFPSNSNTPTYITATPDGGFAVLVYSKYRWSLVRMNADGVIQWMKSFVDYEDNTSSLTRSFADLIYTSDGGFLILGSNQYGRNGTSSVVYKFDAYGNNTLTKSINNDYGNSASPITIARRVIETGDGNYLLVGANRGADLTITAFAAKLNQQLDAVWKKNLGGNVLDDVIRNPYAGDSFIAIGPLAPTGTRTIIIGLTGEISDAFNQSDRVNSTKSFIVAGLANHTIIDVVNERAGDLRLQNLIGQNQSWLKKLGGSSSEVINSAVASNDGGYLLVGTTASTDGDVQGKTNTDLSAWIVKLGPVCTGEIYSVHDGNWNDPSTWSCGQIPTSTDIVHVKHDVVLPQNVVAAARRIIYDLPVRLKWEEGASLQLSQ
jgi:hypothetical protein